MCPSYFFFTDTATTEIYTLSLHDALPILDGGERAALGFPGGAVRVAALDLERFLFLHPTGEGRSEEHTSELQSHHDLVCRLLLEKKKNRGNQRTDTKKN